MFIIAIYFIVITKKVQKYSVNNQFSTVQVVFFSFLRNIGIMNVGKSKLEFYAKITTHDGREITRRVEEEIPNELNPHNLDEFMSSFDDYERHALRARNGICNEITQAWLDEQAKKGA